MSIVDYRGIFNYIDDSLPNDLAMQRRHVWEYVFTMGQPVVIRQVYDQDAVELGLATPDITYNKAYGAGLTFSGDDRGISYGFGPPYLTYAVFGDTAIDDQTPNEPGVFKQFMPNVCIPWAPFVKDFDLIIQVQVETDANLDTINIVATGDRYQIQSVQPVVMRSLYRQYHVLMEDDYNYAENTQIIVQQNAQAARLPRTNPLYEVDVTGDTLP